MHKSYRYISRPATQPPVTSVPYEPSKEEVDLMRRLRRNDAIRLRQYEQRKREAASAQREQERFERYRNERE